MDLHSLSLAEKVGQLLFIGIPSPYIDEVTARLLDEIRPGGICLFARNIRDARQTSALLNDLTARLKVLPFLSVDEEGGLVDRLRRVIGPLPAASKLTLPELAECQAEIIGDSLSLLGFNMDFAPVVDVIDEPRSGSANGLHSRTFGTSPEQVVDSASGFLRNLQARGIVGCLKHFPGLGGSDVDSHEELPSVKVSPEEFERLDLFPYRHMLRHGNVHAVMVAHAVYPELGLQEKGEDGKLLPSSLSPGLVTQLLRKDLGFDGVVLTDDLEMGAIVKNFGVGEAAVMAIEAGNDMACICAGVESIYSAFNAISAAVTSGRISPHRIDESLSRIGRLKTQLPVKTAFDPEKISSLTIRAKELSDAVS